MHNPVSTYRLQFNKDFTLEQFDNIIAYLQKLGVSTVYASPIFESVPGSTHGYDGTNPHRINPEIGTDKQLKKISERLREENIGWLQDIVPNHMAFHPRNKWLMDVLENGERSAYARFFDISWDDENGDGRLMTPFLGEELSDVISKGELKVAYHQGRFILQYFDNIYPLRAHSYVTILGNGKDIPKDVAAFIDQLNKLNSSETDVQHWDEARKQFAELMNDGLVRKYVEECIRTVNDDNELLTQITKEQYYRLCSWQETDKNINYRRFFTINGLICLNIQDEEVFSEYHKAIKQYVDDGTFQGLRIDHIDGLHDPTKYLENLRGLAGDDTYIVVEKILEQGEESPGWPIQGNTGYDFLGMVNNLFTNSAAEAKFTKFYQKLTKDEKPMHRQLHEKKAAILFGHMNGELSRLSNLFKESITDKNALTDIDDEDIRFAIAELLIECPVYRYYGNRLPLQDEERKNIKDILSAIRERKAELIPAIDLLEKTILREEPDGATMKFYQRCMQFTGPLMAKGMEDTLMYSYNRFIGHNEVGDSPEAFGYTTQVFHKLMEERQEKWPLSINTTSTHDTKRGEDVRARLNVLTDLNEEWISTVKEWKRLNKELKTNHAPDANDEYFIYQTLIGAYPMSPDGDDNIEERLTEYMQKALREAKLHSNWASPNEEYESATAGFIAGLLNRDRPFWKSFSELHQRIVDHGIVNSLAQLALKCTCPGVPDIYQGTELWDLSLVDPDNRRAVDYEARLRVLGSIDNASEELLQTLWNNRYDAGIKLWLTRHLLRERQQHPELYAKGNYIPLTVKGKHKDNIFAFARRYQKEWTVIAVPLHTAQISDKQNCLPENIDWGNTRIILPQQAAEKWTNLGLPTVITLKHEIEISELFKEIPLAVLRSKERQHKRDAGVLMAISSLPSAYGVGDIGHEAKAFADFLYNGCQSYWQLLPLNPTEMGSGHSPYSSISSMAGNTLLLSPDLLVKAGLLSQEETEQAQLPANDKADYEAAERIKNDLYNKAYANYKSGNFTSLRAEFKKFCRDEAYWLDDFALYVVLKQEHAKPWFQWPDEHKKRDKAALMDLSKTHEDEIGKVKWLQLIFSLQWGELRECCNSLGIKLFGDVPFYVSYDSADVWSNPDIFCLDGDRNMTGVAGVPPDYFSEDGQLWGMPTFNWEKLKADNYSWWISRLRKNLELFDVVRLDHFRAFAEYWQVPAGEATAKNGKWIPGPGAEFFNVVNAELGHLPFIAEDLGDNMEFVYLLRDEIGLPGMKVLQFAFGEDMPDSVDIPHNYVPNVIAYTGTHDNNTTVGWYHQEANKADHKRLEQYVGSDVRIKNVHKVLARMAYASVAKTVIVPVQDLLGLDETHRMNTPGSAESNWTWRLKPGQLGSEISKLLRSWTKFYNRY